MHRRAPPAPSRRRQRHVSTAGGRPQVCAGPAGSGTEMGAAGGGATCGPRGFAAPRSGPGPASPPRSVLGAERAGLAGSQPASRGASVCVTGGCAEGLGSRRPFGVWGWVAQESPAAGSCPAICASRARGRALRSPPARPQREPSCLCLRLLSPHGSCSPDGCRELLTRSAFRGRELVAFLSRGDVGSVPAAPAAP